MDILTHTLSGIAIGTVVSSFSTGGIREKLKIVVLSGFAAALPDSDAISLWSSFDSNIGKVFNLSASGKEIYSAKYWYSHHAFMHSAFAAVLFAAIIGLLHYPVDIWFTKPKEKSLLKSLNKNKLVLIGFILGFWLHLLEDMPTPSSTWGGVNLLWPSRSYVGGTGDIWWWNNYDIFLIVSCVIILNLILLIAGQFTRFNLKKFTAGVFVLGFAFAFIQIKTRDFDFAYTGYTARFQEFEIESKRIQRDILGDRLYYMMEKFDNNLHFYF